MRPHSFPILLVGVVLAGPLASCNSRSSVEAVESRLALDLAVIDIQRLVGPDFDPWR